MIKYDNFEDVITKKGSMNDDSRYQGYVFETVCIILIIFKLLPINFKKILKKNLRNMILNYK